MTQRQEDERGIPYVLHSEKRYYNRSNSAKYVGMSDAGYTRKREALAREDGIKIPIVMLPVSRQMRFIDSCILDVFRQKVRVGEEEKWKDELRKVIAEVNSSL